MTETPFPPGWNQERVARLLEYYEHQTEDQAVAEDEAAYENTTETMMGVPVELVSKVRALIAQHHK